MSTEFQENKFFENYSKSRKKEEGIPGFIMNAPFVTREKKGDIGLELEVEATNNLPRDANIDNIIADKSKSMWVAKADGSLRGNAMEYVVSQPIFVDEATPMVNGLFDAFKKYGTRLRNSNRCSTHVHINAGGLTVDQITAIIALWTTLEEPLIRWCGEPRINNHYSLSSKNSRSLLDSWEGFLRTGGQRWNDGLKYSSLNLLTLHRFGSVEFRCGPAADTPEIPIRWATFLYYLCKFATENYKDLFSLPRDLSELGGVQLFQNICKQGNLDDFAKEVLDKCPEKEFNEEALVGFRNAQSIVLGFPWNRWSELINREYVPQPFGKKKVSNPAAEDFVDFLDEPRRAERPVPGPIPVRRRHVLPDDLPGENGAIDDVVVPNEAPADVPMDEEERIILNRVHPRNARLINTMKRVARQEAEDILRQRYDLRAWPAWEMRETYHERLSHIVNGFVT